MKGGGDPAEVLAALLADPGETVVVPDLVGPDGEPMCEPVVMELFRSFMMWEAGAAAAGPAVEAVSREVVDLNEFRVCLDDELVAIVGIEDDFAEERVSRCRSALNWIFAEEHSVSLASLRATGKREARAYLQSIDGVPAFVASRVALVALGAHAVPVDARLCAVLCDHGAVPEGSDVEQAASWLERQIRAGDGLSAVQSLEALATKHSVSKNGRAGANAGS